ncbi:hypothetical protein RSAG8_08659, partial [Rhizoctonia solani AG-8 WAC10335]
MRISSTPAKRQLPSSPVRPSSTAQRVSA